MPRQTCHAVTALAARFADHRKVVRASATGVVNMSDDGFTFEGWSESKIVNGNPVDWGRGPWNGWRSGHKPAGSAALK